MSERAAIGPLDIRRVMAALPHRYPMLLVDRVESLDPDKGIVAIKAVTINEPFFQGHFPGRPIMPAVLIVEALAQAAGVLAVEALGLAGSGKLVYFMAIEGAKFRAPVEPGVLLKLEVEFVQKRASVCKFAGRASVDGKLAAEANFTAMIADPPAGCELAAAQPHSGINPATLGPIAEHVFIMLVEQVRSPCE
jgi:3-hydroxyacyl-[acyl-carrier-protein] dehydratase